MTKQTCPFVLQIAKYVMVQDMTLQMRHMLLNAHLAEQTPNIPQYSKSKSLV